MTSELSALPESFAAGTFLRYRRQLSRYPSNAWTLKLYLAGASVLTQAAVSDGDDFVLIMEAALTATLTAGLYKWVERVSNASGEVYEVASGIVTILPNLATAWAGREQEWLERAVAALKAQIEGRLPAGMESYQIAGRVVAKMPVKEAVDLLTSLEARLARLGNPGFVTRPVLVSFTGPGFDR